jgi:hypothetical protein
VDEWPVRGLAASRRRPSMDSDRIMRLFLFSAQLEFDDA